MAISLIPQLDRTSPTFKGDVDALFAGGIQKFATEANALAGQMGAIAAGSANKMIYRFASSTTMADPAPGYLRLNAAAQSAATAIALDVLGADTVDYTSLIGTFVASTSAVRGNLRVEKLGDPTQFLLFSVSALATPAGYRQLTVACIQSSGAAFVAEDLVLLSFTRNGDKGDTGANGFSNMVVARTTQIWTAPAGITKAKFTVINGGRGAAYDSLDPGIGGDASISIRAVTPGVAYTLTVGGGGVGGSESSNQLGGLGGSSTVSGAGLTTLTTANGDLTVPGGRLGDSLYARTMSFTSSGMPVTAPGQGGPYGGANSGGSPGAAGAVIVEY
jgi:hypothetical protein